MRTLIATLLLATAANVMPIDEGYVDANGVLIYYNSGHMTFVDQPVLFRRR